MLQYRVRPKGLHPIKKGDVPFETIHIDHFGPVDSGTLIKKYIFIIIDAFTKYVRLYPVKTTKSKEAITWLRDYFQNYSNPKIIISDRGSAFTSHEFKEFVDERGIKHIKIATGSPQANGQVERVNRSLAPMLAKLTDSGEGKPWYRVLVQVEHAMNNTIHRSTGKTPSELFFGVNQRGLVHDQLKDVVCDEPTLTIPSLPHIKLEAAQRIAKNQSQQKTHFDAKHKIPRQYAVGDLVMVRNFDNTVGAPRKLIPYFKESYGIIKVLRNDRYVVADLEGLQNTQRSYIGTWEASNLRLILTLA